MITSSCLNLCRLMQPAVEVNVPEAVGSRRVEADPSAFRLGEEPHVRPVRILGPEDDSIRVNPVERTGLLPVIFGERLGAVLGVLERSHTYIIRHILSDGAVGGVA
jgi:hypothetical protein